MTNCPACLRAESNPLSGIYQANCMRCTARQIAQGPEAKARERDPSALQAAMRRSWPDQADYQKGRALVWEFVKTFEEVNA